MKMKCDICRRRKAVQVVILRWKGENGEDFVDRKLVCEEEAKFVSRVMDADKVETKILKPVDF